MTHTVVVGGGIAGLSAAYLLSQQGRQVTVLEASPQVGGKLRLADVGGVSVDVGAEAMLNRRPEAVELAREVGFGLVHPATLSSRVWTRGALRALPRSVMGVPADLAQLEETGLLTEGGLARAREETRLPVPVGDQSVAEFVASRLGDEVVDRLVEPLLGGVYAGHTSELSARATIPQVVGLLERHDSLLEAAAAQPKPSEVPVFAGVDGGIGQLPQRLVRQGSFEVRTGVTVRTLRKVAAQATEQTRADRFELVAGPVPEPRVISADEVVLATPAAPTARLLSDLTPAASSVLAEIEYASMAIVTMAFPAAGSAPLCDSGSSGFLVPPIDNRRIKAATFSCNKWEWVRDAGRGVGGDDVLLMRTSLGRHREEATLQLPDEELVRISREELREAVGIDAEPIDTHVQRWGGALPQYAVGHLDRVARIRASLSGVDGLVVCGAAYDGIGIPATIASARRAVRELLDT